MRIIAGSKRRLRLKTPAGNNVRPTTDRIKETLFNMIQNEIPGSCFLDLFAGSGQIGLEAVSRGARRAVFVERDKKAAACIRENIASVRSENECLLLAMDAVPALRFLEGKYCFDLIFMDPPYGNGLEGEVLSYLKSSSLIHEDTLIILETAIGEDISYLQQEGFALVKEKKYKTNAHVFFQLEDALNPL